MLPLAQDANPFKQPFLELQLTGSTAKSVFPDCSVLRVDVAGKLSRYITEERKPTKRLVRLCKVIARTGSLVTGFKPYEGSEPPHLILRNGELFARVPGVERPPPEVCAYEYREPQYCGPARPSR